MGSKRQPKEEVLIFSVYNATRGRYDNRDNHDVVLMELEAKGIPFKVLGGRYNGEKENSILVKIDQISLVRELCARYKQKCYMHLDKDRDATLHFETAEAVLCPDNTVSMKSKVWSEKIGRLRQVHRYFATDEDTYSYDPLTDQYFIVK